MSNAFTLSGKQAILDMLAARPLRASLFDENGAELADGLGYSAGGVLLTGAITGVDGDTAWLTFNDPQWPSAGFMGAAQMRISDESASPARTEFARINFTEPLNGQGATFRVEFPPANGQQAIIRF